MTELFWPIEKIEPKMSGKWWVYPKQDGNNAFVATSEDLAAAGIPAEPYPAPPVTITVTAGDRSEEVELTERNIEWCLYQHSDGKLISTAGKIGAALRRLGVQP